MAVDVQTFAFLLFRNTQTDGHIRQLIADEGHNGRPHDGDGNTFQLHQHLVNHRDAFCVPHATQRFRREDTGHDTTDDAADAVYTEDIARVIDAQNTFQRRHTPQTRQTGDQPDKQRAANTDVATSWRDTNQTGNCT